ncbi:MAG: BON domain-containing protein [Sphingobacteriales bacterium]|nr:MAG: BON domain-containing protein [Sphingobacteriales bacterium]
MKNRLILSLVLSATLAACAGSPTSRSTGQTIDDTAITARVKTEIAKDVSVGQAAGINVDTYRGTVSLSGFVESQAQAQAATRAASQVPGVQKVDNNLKLKSRQ